LRKEGGIYPLTPSKVHVFKKQLFLYF